MEGIFGAHMFWHGASTPIQLAGHDGSGTRGRQLLQLMGGSVNANMVMYIVFIVVLTVLAILLVCNRSRRLRAARRAQQQQQPAHSAGGGPPTLVFLGTYPPGMRPVGVAGTNGSMPWQQQAQQRPGRTPTPHWLVESLPIFKHHAASQPVADGQAKQQADEEREETCAVCCCEYEEGDTLKTLPCLHSYHAECIGQWLGVDHVCPICKHDLLLYTANSSEGGASGEHELQQQQQQLQQQQQQQQQQHAGAGSSPLASRRSRSGSGRPADRLYASAASQQRAGGNAAAGIAYPSLGQPVGGFMAASAPPSGAYAANNANRV